jgi:hypothetical protein
MSPYRKKILPVRREDPRSSCFSCRSEMKHPKHVHDAQFCTSASVLQLSLDKKVWYRSHHSVVPRPTQKSDRWHIWAAVPLPSSKVTNAQLKPEAKMMIWNKFSTTSRKWRPNTMLCSKAPTKEKDNLEDATSCRKKPSILAQQDGNVIHAQLWYIR